MPDKTSSKTKQRPDNSPLLWKDEINWPDRYSNKYTRGHVLVVGGPIMTGAARLAAMAARRAGAGIVSIATSDAAFDIYATATEPGTIITPFKGLDGFKKIISSKRKNTIVIGPGAGDSISGASVEDMVLAAIGSGLNVVVDADGINAFKGNPEKLFKAIKANSGQANSGQANSGKGKSGQVVLTPHGGEFARLFPQLTNTPEDTPEEKLEMTLKAARLSGAVVVFKGADTAIAGPGGMGVVDSSAPAWLATAGSGDVLAGIIGAMLAQGVNGGMDGMSGASAGVWIQARSASIFGPGLVAEDIIQTLPRVWSELAREISGK